ncbi:hypothetical protein ACFJI0_00395 [Hydrogenophaga sp. UC242_53]|uniref:hypothetical protein n=1 Tax=Hydrogenophaga sp. UC242_53 TaxID=3350170 RepID=UPI0036D3DFE3
MLHHLLAQQPVDDARVGLEQRALFIERQARQQHRARQGQQDSAAHPPLQALP